VTQEAALVEIRELESDYEILGELGRGGMAVVYLARDRQLGRQVAIKVIHAAAGADEQTVGRQLTEARTVAQLQHPNVVAMYAVKRLSTLGLALVMQYVPGRTLERAMREDGVFSPERTEAVLSDIVAALAYAHARGVIHRDIKPDNVFLNDDTGRALLSDFGIALSAEEGRQQLSTDMIVGTPAYMSPEQIDGLELDGRSDVFGLGLIGFEMLAGARPWLDESITDVMYRQKYEMLAPLAEVRPDTPDRLRVVIERALAKDRDERWPTAAMFLDALTSDEWVPDPAAAVGAEAPVKPPPPRAVTPTPVRSLTPASASTPLNTVQYRRDPDTTPRRSIPSFRPPVRRRDRRLMALGIPAVLVAAAAAAMVTHPEFIARAAGLGRHVVDDSAQHAEEVAIETVRDSADRMTAEAARRAADSAAAAATSSADSSAALRVAIARDSLLAVRDSLVKIAERKPPVVASGSVTRSTPPPPRRDSVAPPGPAEPPAPIHAPAPPAVVAGGTHTCALNTEGVVSCWGGDDRGQLGIGSTARQPSPTRVGGDIVFSQVSAGIAHSCGVARTGAAYCWGDNGYGQLGSGQVGDSSADGRLTPTRVGGAHTFRTVATGTTHTCGLTTSGEVWCWGRNLYGQLGDGSTQDRATPVRVESAAHFVALTVGWNHSCALDPVGQAYCWGQNASGQLGDGTTIVRATPTPVVGGGLFRAIAAGGSHTCALSTIGQAFCWGRNMAGQLGTDDARDHPVPVKVSSALVYTDITAGGVHSCALTPSGEADCWGRNSYGQLGDGSTTDRPMPVKVRGGQTFVAIHASGAHTCATSTGGAAYCWGNNSDGQLGDGTTNDRSDPTPVSGAR
jgi:serine/threonine protein kinase/alpha-tubulin suppressor-like RCC1 family protein